ncbi:MAG: hypothetical protein RLZZ387_3483 [Chloroflexota bacterium]
MVIDAHIHYTPPALRVRLPELVAREPYWGMLLGGPSGLSIQGWADAERMIADMDRAGVDRVVVQGEYYQRHESCVARNDESLELVRRYPGRVAAFAVLQPLAGAQALSELERCAAGGLCGVGELNPYAQGFALDEPAFLTVVETCIRLGLPLLLHANEEVGRAYPGKATTPLAHYYALAVRYPELRLVLAHWGGGLFLYEIIPGVRRELANVWYDTAASPLVYPTDAIFRAALGCVDYRKILYASDYPLLIFPREQAEPDFRPFLRQIDALGLDEAARADILGGNAARLLWGADRAPATGDQGRKIEDRTAATDDRRPGAVTLAPAPITARGSVALIAAAHPTTRAVFERHAIPWRDTPVPFWEPIGQAAAARGYGETELRALLAELNEATGPTDSITPGS